MSASNQFVLLAERRFLPFFLTQGLGAFNDNLFKQAMVALIVFLSPALTGSTSLWTNLAAGLFILPFFLFSSTSGQLADKYDKRTLAVATKLLELAIVAVGAVGFWLHASGDQQTGVIVLLAALGLLGLQSTIFGPLKYAILPQVLDPRELTGGNGLIEMATFLAILLGSMAGSALIQQGHGAAWPIIAATLAVAVMGLASAWAMPSAPALAPQLKIDLNPLRETWRNLREIAGQRTVFLSCLGISWFWFYGSIWFTQLPVYVRDVLGGNESVFALLLAVFSIGTALGSLLCEVLSKHRVEIGLVPFGSIGMTVFGAALYFIVPAPTGASGLDLAGFLARPETPALLTTLLLMAMFGGFYLVPLFALIQSRSEPSKRARVIAANNVLNALFMVLASVVAVLLLDVFTVPQLLLATALMNAVVAVYIYGLVPEFLLRFLAWMLVNTLYRLRVEGLQRIPEEGAVLLVCNHVSYVDALLIGGSVPRPTRFVMYHKIYQLPVMHFLFKTVRTIPICSVKENPALLERAFERIAEELDAGEVVCIFPEGGLTGDGEIQTFRSGVERILAKNPVPVIPMALTGLWGSLFSRWHRKMGKALLPRRFWSRVGLRIGTPAAPSSSATLLEREVRALRGDAA
ncbi:MAG: MFS transporter [Xanthomonadales bacterium]|jgi:1-acyl-sn-glycerol-3-phosphate acyltransferase|nr:MFS transporter [Xanthomonadales bacterium]